MEMSKQLTPLSWKDAAKIANTWKKKHDKRLRLATYANETLTMTEIQGSWISSNDRRDLFPDVGDH
jgi:hypothetical protein